MDSPDPPDYSEQIDTQNQITDRQMLLAEQSYADQKALTDKFLPMFESQAQLSIDQQAKTNERADTQWENYSTNFLPLEGEFAKQAADFNTVGRQEQDANRARADVAAQFDRADAARAEEIAAAGVMPGSGRSLALSQASNIERAKAMASAGDTARRATEATGLSLMNSAIGVGRGQVAGGLQAADLSLRQGASAQGSAGGAVGMAGAAAQGASSIYGAASGANQGAASIMGNAYNQQLAASNANTALFGDVLGAGLGAAGTAGGFGKLFSSSKTTKHVGKKLSDATSAIKASPAKEWRYRKGLGDGNTGMRVGPMAEDLRDATGGVVSDGRTVDAISLMGLHHAAIGEQADRLEKLEKKLSLSDGARKPEATKKLGGLSLSSAVSHASKGAAAPERKN